jgi:hypothetical protein
MNLALTSVNAMERSAELARKSLAYLQKNYRYLKADPEFFWMKTAARFERARARPRDLPPPPALTLSTDMIESPAGIDTVLETIESEGYFVGMRLRPHAVEALLRHCAESVCFGDRRPELPMRLADREHVERALGRKLSVASYFETQNEWPVFRALRDDPWLAILARGYLGEEPLYLRSELAWTFPGERSQAEKIAGAQVFHCDINDFRTLKFFFYLTDVGADSGPHEYIKKDPLGRKWRHQLMGQRVASLPDGELQRSYGEHRVVRVEGSAGLGFVGDPYTFHRGGVPESGARLLLQLEFGIRRYRTWYFDV